MKKIIFFLFIFCFTTKFIKSQIIFHAEKEEIFEGDSVKLMWDLSHIKNVKKVSIKKTKDSLSIKGELYVKPHKKKFYKLIVEVRNKFLFGTNEITKNVKIKVLKTEISEFKTKDANNTDESPTILQWKTKNAKFVIIKKLSKEEAEIEKKRFLDRNSRKKKDVLKFIDSDNSLKKLECKGEKEFIFDTTSFIKLIAVNKNNLQTSRTIQINIKNIEFINFKKEIYIKDTFHVNWNFKYSKYLKIKGLKKEFFSKDKSHIYSEKDFVFSWEVYRNNGKIETDSSKIKVLSPVFKFLIPKAVYKGSPAYIKWEVEKNFTVELSGLSDEIITKNKGNEKIPLNIKKNYLLIVKDKNGEIVYNEEKRIEEIKSPILEFEFPKVSSSNIPIDIKWKVAKGFKARIEGLKYKAKQEKIISIVPEASKTYKLIVTYRGKEIETREKEIEILNRRSFVRSKKDFSELNENDEIFFEIFSVDNSKFPEEVKLYLLAVDSLGFFIEGLENENKRRKKKIIKKIFEKLGDKKVKVKKFKFERNDVSLSVPYDISIALDCSGSMFYTISSLEKSIISFIKNKYKSDRISISKFNHNLVEVTKLEKDSKNLLSTFHNNGFAGGSTALYAGGDFALKNLNNNKNNKILLLFTDGMENSSFQYFGNYATNATELAKEAIKNNVTVHVISYGAGVNNRIMKAVAKTTGGNFYKINNTKEINRVFEELPIIMRSFYTITYKPKLSKSGNHEIELEYDNLKDEKSAVTQTYYHTGEDLEIKEFLDEVPKKYWMIEADNLQKQFITVPQAVAFFDYNKEKLTDEYKKSVQTYINFLNERKNVEIIIFGHTDSKGKAEYCMKLSERRANTVKNYMVKKGINKNRIHIIACGKKYPKWFPEIHEWQKKENRRIEILIVK